MESSAVGYTVQGRPIELQTLSPRAGPVRRWVLLLGSVHGDEPEGVWLLDSAMREWADDYLFRSTGVAAVVCANPDGRRARTRWNASGVDLNRNLPTRDWTASYRHKGNNPGPAPSSEPETRALLATIERFQPAAILSIHSMRRYQVNINGPALEWGRRLAQVCDYPVTEDIGYPCPGSLGTYAGAELQIPTITLEVQRGLRRSDVLKIHSPVVQAAVAFWDE
ncbi:MAG: succinylglutamate desuccinylase/aspartoacylase family protein [Armatimonadetes bacterium]|nr:succinylglutamate desuccinylase/aspartoacylase family protein [Armatimonadota bacterium]